MSNMSNNIARILTFPIPTMIYFPKGTEINCPYKTGNLKSISIKYLCFYTLIFFVSHR